MIELRWLLVNKDEHKLLNGKFIKNDQMTLQYRQKVHVLEHTAGLTTGSEQWSDWQDVPVVSEDQRQPDHHHD